MKTLLLVAAAFAMGVAGAAQSSPAPKADPCLAPECIAVHEGESVTLPDAPSPEGPAYPSPAVLCSRSPEICATLPDAPLPRPTPGFWAFGGADDAHPLRTNHEVWHDKTWRATQTFWLGAIIYDVELTHAGLAHHRCVEGNSELSRHPSRTGLYLSNLPEYLVGTGFNWMMLKFVSKPLIFEMPAIASVAHIRGGSEWVTRCW
jgi:hypothetical protein